MIDTILCPSCQRVLTVDATVRGLEVQCPSCGCQFYAAEVAETTSAPLPTVVAVELPRPVEPAAPAPTVPGDGPRSGGRSPRGAVAGADRPPKKAARSRGAVMVVVGLTSVCVLVPLCGGIWALLPNTRPDFVGVALQGIGLAEDERREWGPDNPFNEDEVARDLKPLFSDLGGAFRDRARERIAGHFDPKRMMDEFAGLDPVAFGGRANQPQAVQGMREGMANSLVQQAPLLAWTSSEFKQIKQLGKGEVAVIARHAGPDGAIVKMRWWLTKRDGTWRIYDFEDLDMGMRMSTVAGTLGAAGVANVQRLAQPIQTVREALLAILVQRDADAAEKKLKQVEAVDLPGPIDVLRWFVTALIQMHRSQHREALGTLDRVVAIRPDMPIVDLLKGMCQNALREHDSALRHLRAYEKLLGDDTNVCRELGEALRSLNRLEEARAAYRKSLDYHPDNLDAYVGLMRGLGPGDARDELGPRFAKLANPREDFAMLQQECQQARDADALTQIAQTMLILDKAYAPAQFALAVAGAWNGRAEQALPAFDATLALEQDAGKRAGYSTQFLDAMAGAGLARRAYAASPEPRAAFAILAAELKKTYRMDDLPGLIRDHAKKAADDPLLPFYRGEVFVQRGQYKLADKAFTEGMAKPPEPATLQTFGNSRVLARYHVGQALSAHAAIGPRQQTFTQLAALCEQHSNDALLETLLDAHAKTDPDDASIARYRCRLKIRQNHLPEAVALFKAILAKEPQQELRKQAANDFIFAMLDAGKLLEGYRAAPDACEAFQSVAEDLLESNRLDELLGLIDAHRKLHPDDERLTLYTSLVLTQRQQWDDAARILDEAWRRLPVNQRNNIGAQYVLALYKVGRWLEAYKQVEPRKSTFAQLARLLIQDKKLADLNALIAEHRPHAGNDPDLYYFEARALAMVGQPADAMPLLHKAFTLQPNGYLRTSYVNDVAIDLLDLDLGLEAYRIAPDKVAIFATLANQMVFKKKMADLDKLLIEHGKDHAKDPWHKFYAGELALLRGDLATAERSFAAALGSVPHVQRWSFQQGLRRAQIQAGKVAEAYRQASADTRSFDTLADLCVQEKNAAQLAALIAIHRQAEPDDPALTAWELEVSWLKMDYEGAVKLLTGHREELFDSPRFTFKCDSYLIRALVKLKRASDAVRGAVHGSLSGASGYGSSRRSWLWVLELRKRLIQFDSGFSGKISLVTIYTCTPFHITHQEAKDGSLPHLESQDRRVSQLPRRSRQALGRRSLGTARTSLGNAAYRDGRSRSGSP